MDNALIIDLVLAAVLAVFALLGARKGLIRSLMGPMTLCIGYCLMASLIVAITVVPAAASTVLKKAEPKRLVWFEKIQDKYAHSLEWCLQHRALPLLAAVVLLAFCGWKVFSMGVVLLPEISSNEATIALSTDDGLTKEESYGVAGQVVEAVMAVDGVEEVGVTTDTTVAGIDIGQLGLPSAITDLLSAAMLGIFRQQHYNTMLTKDFPQYYLDCEETGAPELLWVASKSGSMNDCRNDGGIVPTPYGEYVIVLMNKDFHDIIEYNEHPAMVYGARVSRMILDQVLACEGRLFLS